MKQETKHSSVLKEKLVGWRHLADKNHIRHYVSQIKKIILIQSYVCVWTLGSLCILDNMTIYFFHVFKSHIQQIIRE